MKRGPLVFLFLIAAGCIPGVTGAPCASDQNCPTTQYCTVAHVCDVTGTPLSSDGGLGDAGHVDAGGADAGMVDAGASDGGGLDAGLTRGNRFQFVSGGAAMTGGTFSVEGRVTVGPAGTSMSGGTLRFEGTAVLKP